MPGDASASGEKRGKTGRVAVGRYLLEVGDPAGTELMPLPTESDPHALRRALAQERRRHRKSSPEAIEAAVDDASTVTDKVERATGLCNELISGHLDLQSASDEVDALIGLLQRLDRQGRWQEALRVARCLSTLAALIRRWIELLRSLQTALHAAKELGDELDEAWALHELGTMHLAAGRHSEADRLLVHSREIRERVGDRKGLEVTDRNLQVLCRALRAQLHRGGYRRPLRLLRQSPAAVTIAVVALVVVGGVAGATIDRSASSDRRPFHVAAVAFTFTPSAPHKGQRVVFAATASDREDPVVSYTWRWGDGDPSGHRVRSHVYWASRTYKATLIVKDASGHVTGEASRLVVVLPPPFPGPNAAFSFEPRSPTIGKTVTFDARSSFDTGAKIVDYAWEFGDGKTGDGPVVSHTYSDAKPYLATLEITDARGMLNTLSETVAVGSQPSLRRTQIGLVCPPSIVVAEESVLVSGSIAPPRPGATLTVTYIGPREHRLTAQARIRADGSYEAAKTPDLTGGWSVQSSWEGDAKYLPSASEACTFSVNPMVLRKSSTSSSQSSTSETTTPETTTTTETATTEATSSEATEQTESEPQR